MNPANYMMMNSGAKNMKEVLSDPIKGNIELLAFDGLKKFKLKYPNYREEAINFSYNTSTLSNNTEFAKNEPYFNLGEALLSLNPDHQETIDNLVQELSEVPGYDFSFLVLDKNRYQHYLEAIYNNDNKVWKVICLVLVWLLFSTVWVGIYQPIHIVLILLLLVIFGVLLAIFGLILCTCQNCCGGDEGTLLKWFEVEIEQRKNDIEEILSNYNKTEFSKKGLRIVTCEYGMNLVLMKL